MKQPTYQDLLDFLPIFKNEKMDLRVFRIPSRVINKNIDEKQDTDTDTDTYKYEDTEIHEDIESSTFHVGDFPVEKTYPKETLLSKEFLEGEIKKICDQWEFDKTMKPYPDRDFYYNIIINDFESLKHLVDYWMHSRYSLVKGVVS